jgi:hypothetical protein
VSLPRQQQLAVLGAGTSCVFSRAEPKHKQDIVRLLKDMGEVGWHPLRGTSAGAKLRPWALGAGSARHRAAGWPAG